ncbi:MAG: hypothetical protein PHN22_02375 [Candidatus ainarchaeum sp.]|nr:hypothetical protein [Candidatus ainarchaeum sp.]
MLDEKDFIKDSCLATPGFEFYPKKKLKIDLDNLSKVFKEHGYYISKNNSPFYIHVKTDICEVTIFSSLKIIIKDLIDENKAILSFKKILNLINKVF